SVGEADGKIRRSHSAVDWGNPRWPDPIPSHGWEFQRFVPDSREPPAHPTKMIIQPDSGRLCRISMVNSLKALLIASAFSLCPFTFLTLSTLRKLWVGARQSKCYSVDRRWTFV